MRDSPSLLRTNCPQETFLEILHRARRDTNGYLLLVIARMSSEVQVTLVLLIAVLTLSSAFPQKTINVDKTSEDSASLPFLQFKNGGLRVNFGGYHAEAGLGGLLGGGRGGGGLHVSAGTPDGAHASAGLGGLLGDNGSAGGGLHARAGLGNGGPEAKAGLGGFLDGSSKRNRGQGVLYADAALKKEENEESERKNIQVIPRASKNKEVTASSKEASANLDSGAAASSSASTVTPLEKEKGDSAKNTKIGISVLKIKNLDRPDSSDVSSSSDTNDNTELRNRGVYPARWYRKRLRAGARKNVLYNTVLSPEADPLESPSSHGIFARAGPEVNYSSNEGQKASTLFDDIFNIPISTLNAVNQLLKNKIG